MAQNSRTAGILDIVASIIGLALYLYLASRILGFAISGTGRSIWQELLYEGPLAMLAVAVPVLLPNALSIIGGILALKRKAWWMALLGSVAALLTFLPLGIIALPLIIKSTRENCWICL